MHRIGVVTQPAMTFAIAYHATEVVSSTIIAVFSAMVAYRAVFCGAEQIRCLTLANHDVHSNAISARRSRAHALDAISTSLKNVNWDCCQTTFAGTPRLHTDGGTVSRPRCASMCRDLPIVEESFNRYRVGFRLGRIGCVYGCVCVCALSSRQYMLGIFKLIIQSAPIIQLSH